MTVLEITRSLGKAIQEDERYQRFDAARKASDADSALAELISKIKLVQLAYQNESEKNDFADKEKLSSYNEEFEGLYRQIMLNPNMQTFDAAKAEIDDMMNDVMSVLSQCVEGEDPEKVEPEKHSCDGGCDSCGGCH